MLLRAQAAVKDEVCIAGQAGGHAPDDISLSGASVTMGSAAVAGMRRVWLTVQAAW